MNAFLSLPDWAPGWLGPVLMILGALFALAFLLMPFTVFSLKSRLDQIEMKLDELHAEFQSMTVAEPRTVRAPPPAWPEPAAESDRYPVHPPIPPMVPRGAAVRPPEPPPEPRRDPYRDQLRPTRSEPKLHWPR
jgi:hypothetical protein